jgi:hypothetical protein
MFGKSAVWRVVLAWLSLSSCVATVGTEPAYTEVEYAPADIEVYPHTIYEGRTVYWVGDRWYYRQGPHWVYYTREPSHLSRYRARVEQAPRAPRHEYYERAAPRAPKGGYGERGAKRGYDRLPAPAYERHSRHGHHVHR